MAVGTRLLLGISVTFLGWSPFLTINAAQTTPTSPTRTPKYEDNNDKDEEYLGRGNLHRLAPCISVPKDFWLPRSLTQTPEWSRMEWKDVHGCCQVLLLGGDEDDDDDDDDDDATTTTQDEKNDHQQQPSTCTSMGKNILLKRQTIGQLPQFTKASTMHVLEEAIKAWKGGSGKWTQMTLSARIAAIENVLNELLSPETRDLIVEALMWEIGKNRPDAQAELDRTIQFAKQVINVITSHDPDVASAEWQTISGTTHAWVRRAALGIILCLGPYNYPINETYATLIPALLMGNVVILKIPTVGGLAHLLTLQAFDKFLPPGVINFVSGPGRNTAPPLMESGKIDGLAFIGGSDTADELIHAHPHPHRLKVFLQLEANNMAIYLPDLFLDTAVEQNNHHIDEKQRAKTVAALDNALDQAILGSLSYNGQRCTALKLHMVPTEYAQRFAQLLAKRVEALSIGMPWQQHDHNNNKHYSAITPLPNHKRVSYMKELLDDATAKGATIVNRNGGTILGGSDSTLMVPAVLFPVTSNMRLYQEEQFGPLVPVVPYDDIETCLAFARDGVYAQQVSIFSTETGAVAPLVDQFSAVFGKINLNSQCGRSPDTLPFSGRRSSAMGVMSVKHALLEFSTPTAVAYKDTKVDIGNEALVQGLLQSVNFMQPV